MTERCPTCKRTLPRPIPKIRRKPRKGPMRDAKYRRWCKRQHCSVCVLLAAVDATKVDFYACRPVDPAHTENNGMRSKGPDSSCAPLCRKHHQEFDRGRAAFEKKYSVDMRKIAAEHYERFLEQETN